MDCIVYCIKLTILILYQVIGLYLLCTGIIVAASSRSDTSLGDPQGLPPIPVKKKFGGSLRKLFQRKRSSSAQSSRHRNLLTDRFGTEHPDHYPTGSPDHYATGSPDRYTTHSPERYSHDRYTLNQNNLDPYAADPRTGSYDRLSVEGDRRIDPNNGSRSSFERDLTPPHHRTLSTSSSFGSEAVRRDREPIQLSVEKSYDEDLHQQAYEDRRHYSLPGDRRGQQVTG